MNKEERVLELIKTRGFSSQAEFCRYIDVPKSTFSTIIKRGLGKASIDNVLKICKGLDITVDELMNIKKESFVLSEKEKEMIKKYRKLNNDNKLKLEGMMDILLVDEESKKQRNKSKKGA